MGLDTALCPFAVVVNSRKQVGGLEIERWAVGGRGGRRMGYRWAHRDEAFGPLGRRVDGGLLLRGGTGFPSLMRSLAALSVCRARALTERAGFPPVRAPSLPFVC
jgi:hypothetical protein